jgi:drug/metabolite transporter (DMT)-like permease
MSKPEPRPRWQRWLIQLAQGVAVVVGLGFGYSFGVQLAGLPLGIVTAICSAVFCAMVVDGLADWVLRVVAKRREPD